MAFIPKQSKFTKYHKGKAQNRVFKDVAASKLVQGSVGLQILEFGRITSKQFESVRQSITKIIKKTGKVSLKGFPTLGVSGKATESRMGKGKGSIQYWVLPVRPGFVFCEISTGLINTAIKALLAAKHRLPVKTKIIFS